MSDDIVHSGERRELISFRIGEQEFCVDIMAVREIRGWSPVTPLPHSPDYVRGVINLDAARRLVLVLDPAELLTPAEQERLDAFQKTVRENA